MLGIYVNERDELELHVDDEEDDCGIAVVVARLPRQKSVALATDIADLFERYGVVTEQLNAEW